MALSTYAELQTAILNFLDRGDSETTAMVPDAIRLLEARLRRDLRGVGADVVTSGSIPAGAEMVLPSDCMELRGISISQSGYEGILEIVPPATLWKQRRLYPTNGRPRYAAVQGNEVHTAPIADQAYAVEVRYTAEIAPLESALTNWLLAGYPDVYLYGTLVEMAGFLKNDARVPVWEQRYAAAITGLLHQRDRIEYPNTPRPVVRPLGY